MTDNKSYQCLNKLFSQKIYGKRERFLKISYTGKKRWTWTEDSGHEIQDLIVELLRRMIQMYSYNSKCLLKANKSIIGDGRGT